MHMPIQLCIFSNISCSLPTQFQCEGDDADSNTQRCVQFIFANVSGETVMQNCKYIILQLFTKVLCLNKKQIYIHIQNIYHLTNQQCNLYINIIELVVAQVMVIIILLSDFYDSNLFLNCNSEFNFTYIYQIILLFPSSCLDYYILFYNDCLK